MRVLFYYTHKQTLGHTTRSISLVKALCLQGAEVLVLQGGMPQPYIRFPKGCKVIDIPFPFDTRTSFHSTPISPYPDKRAKFILNKTTEFSPDIFITEFFPFGRLPYTTELLPTLRSLRKKGTRIIASIGYPVITDISLFQNKKFAPLQKALFAFFHSFLVHTPHQLENPYIQKTIPSQKLSRSYAAIMKKLKKKIIYTGYILPERIITGGTHLPCAKNAVSNTIVISRGGGTVFPKLITMAMAAQRLLDDKVRTINTVIACGPATTSKEMALFQSCLKPRDKGRVFLVDHLADLHDHLKNCLVSVSLCGYNTSVQLMHYGTPSVIVPYKNSFSEVSTNDQVARARLLQERFSSIVLDYDTMTARALANAIKKQMNSPRPAPAPIDWFNGADVAARFIVLGTAN